jgi:hypothetical protein
MTTPIVTETVRNGNPVGTPNPNGHGMPVTPPSDRVW